MLQDKRLILLGVSGGIAVYKALEILRGFIKKNFDVQVVMTQNAVKFVAPLSFSILSGRAVIIDLFSSEHKIDHIEITKRASLFLCAPATANIIGKLACGIADDAMTTMALACACPKIIAPAMNQSMWKNSVVQKNVNVLEKLGFNIISPDSGKLACGDEGVGRLAEPENIVFACQNILDLGKKFSGKTILITAGRTEEMIDPVRYISNRSSGKMGFALARQAKNMGANVVLICGTTTDLPPYADKYLRVRSAQEMHKAVLDNYKAADIIIKAAAVSDYRSENISSNKIKKNDEKLHLDLIKNPDILKELGKLKLPNQYLVGFAAETNDLKNYAKHKLVEKNLDLIVANDISRQDIGFEKDENQVLLIDKKGEEKELPILSKDKTAIEILLKIRKDYEY